MSVTRTRNAMPSTRRLLATAAIIAYLGCLAIGLYWHVVGDVGVYPPAQYLVTWDMFPGYRTRSQRILIVGETERGEFVRLYPSPRQRWRGGLHGDLTRLDFAQQPFAGVEATWLEAELAAAIEWHDAAHGDDPVRTVHVLRERWPAKFNLPKGPYERIALDGDPPADSRYWSVILTSPADAFRESSASGENSATGPAGTNR